MRCMHGAALDIAALAIERGRDFTFDQLRAAPALHEVRTQHCLANGIEAGQVQVLEPNFVRKLTQIGLAHLRQLLMAFGQHCPRWGMLLNDLVRVPISHRPVVCVRPGYRSGGVSNDSDQHATDVTPFEVIEHGQALMHVGQRGRIRTCGLPLPMRVLLAGLSYALVDDVGGAP